MWCVGPINRGRPDPARPARKPYQLPEGFWLERGSF
ncbi:hypothetical protein A2U01_0117950, partial [Trifolium medium]|nr:hypothetical protein [Trifolium medium]